MSDVIERIDSKNPSKEDLKELLEELKRLKKVDVRTVDKDTLVDIKDVKIKTELPVLERLIDYIKQVKNPYCYKIDGIVVKVNFTGERSINECIKDALFGGGLSDPEVPRFGGKNKGGWAI